MKRHFDTQHLNNLDVTKSKILCNVLATIVGWGVTEEAGVPPVVARDVGALLVTQRFQNLDFTTLQM